MDIVFYDLETTIPASHIIEFGCVVVDAETFAEMESFETLVYSDRITSASMAANGITPDMVASAPRIDEVIDVIYAYLHGRIWAGHNIRSFDNPIIRRTFESFFMNAPEPADVIDTLPLARKHLAGKVKNHKLATLAEHFGLGKEDHRSLSDAQLSLQVLMRTGLISLLRENTSNRIPKTHPDLNNHAVKDPQQTNGLQVVIQPS